MNHKEALVTGRVVAGGVGLSGAQVELVLREPNAIGEGVVPGYWNGLYYGFPGWMVLTDSDGYFEVTIANPLAPYYLRAWKSGFAYQTFGPVVEPGLDGQKNVIVELSPGIAADGLLVLPKGVKPSDVRLNLSRMDRPWDPLRSTTGVCFYPVIDRNGRWYVDSLAAGPWLLRIEQCDGIKQPDMMSDARSEALAISPWVIVADSEDSHGLSVDLTADPGFLVRGTLASEGRIREGFAQLLLVRPIALEVATDSLDSAGRFDFRVRQAGKYRLVVTAGTGQLLEKTYTDTIEVSSPVTVWVKNVDPLQVDGPGVQFDK